MKIFLALLTKSLNVSLVRLGVLISSCNIPFKISWTSALFYQRCSIARYASAGMATAEMSVRPSVCLSVSLSILTLVLYQNEQSLPRRSRETFNDVRPLLFSSL